MSGWLSVPGYREAREREDSIRDAAFILEREEIEGVSVLPMNARHFLLLAGTGSPFVCGGSPSEVAAARFLWIVSPQFEIGESKARDKFLKRVRKLPFVATCASIHRYVDETFMDAPGGKASEKIPDTSFVAELVDLLAREYHWTERDILNLPLKRIFQYLRRIQKHHDTDATFVNPSDEIRGKWLREENARLRARNN